MWTHNVSEKIDWFDNWGRFPWKKYMLVTLITFIFLSLFIIFTTFFYFKSYKPTYSFEKHIVNYSITAIVLGIFILISFWARNPMCVKIGFGENNLYLYNKPRKVFKRPLVIPYVHILGLCYFSSLGLYQFVYVKQNALVWSYFLSKDNILRVQKKLQLETEKEKWKGDFQIYRVLKNQPLVEIEPNKYVPLSAWVKMMENKKNEVYWRE
jgi:hypothetical protein